MKSNLSSQIENRQVPPRISDMLEKLADEAALAGVLVGTRRQRYINLYRYIYSRARALARWFQLWVWEQRMSIGLAPAV